MRWRFWEREDKGKSPAVQAGSGKKRRRPSRKPSKKHPGRDVNGRWLPGVSGNPAGFPPKTKRITDALRALGEEELIPDSGWSRNLLLAMLYWSEALLGNEHCMDVILERSDGRLPQSMEFSGPGGGPIQHEDVGLSKEERIRAIASLVESLRAGAGAEDPAGTDKVEPAE